MTSRGKYQSLPDINHVLSFKANSESINPIITSINPIITYICGFDQKQRLKFTENFIKYAQITKQYNCFENY